jgi:hypothetical protein
VAKQIPGTAALDHLGTIRGASERSSPVLVCRCQAISLSYLSFDFAHSVLAQSSERTTALAATPIHAAREALNTIADNIINAPDAHKSRTASADRRDLEYNS